MKKKLIVAVGALAVAIYGSTRTTINPSSLLPPLEVIDVAALADGGTLFMKLQDKSGRYLGVRRIGNLDVNREQQQLTKIIFLADLIPIQIAVDKKSAEWREIETLLSEIVANKIPPEQLALLRSANAADASNQVSPQALAAFELTEWMHFVDVRGH